MQNKQDLDYDYKYCDGLIKEIYQVLSHSNQDIIYESMDDVIECAIENLKLKIFPNYKGKEARENLKSKNFEKIRNPETNVHIADLNCSLDKKYEECIEENYTYEEALYKTLLQLSIDNPLEKTPEEIIDKDSISKLISLKDKLLSDITKNPDCNADILITRITDEFPHFKSKIKSLNAVKESNEAQSITELKSFTEESSLNRKQS